MTRTGLIEAYTADSAVYKQILFWRACVRKATTYHVSAAHEELDHELNQLAPGLSSQNFFDNDRAYFTTAYMAIRQHWLGIFTDNGHMTADDLQRLEDYGCHLYDMRFRDFLSMYQEFRAEFVGKPY